MKQLSRWPGLARSGESNPNAKYTDAQVVEIFDMYYNKGLSTRDIARKIGASQGWVSRSVRGIFPRTKQLFREYHEGKNPEQVKRQVKRRKSAAIELIDIPQNCTDVAAFLKKRNQG